MSNGGLKRTVETYLARGSQGNLTEEEALALSHRRWRKGILFRTNSRYKDVKCERPWLSGQWRELQKDSRLGGMGEVAEE